MSTTPVSFEKYLTDRFVTPQTYDAMPPADQRIWRTDYDAYVVSMSSAQATAAPAGTRDKELEDLKKDEVRERIEFARSLAPIKLRVEVAKAKREEAKAAIWEHRRDRKSSRK